MNPSPPSAPPLGLYVHVPFCRRKCAYCDFYSVTRRNHRGAFLKALVREIRLRQAPGRVVDTVFFGGGTPSLLTPRQVEDVLGAMGGGFALSPRAEITLEANPGTVDGRRLRGYRQAGVNRLSLGVQSFHDGRLAWLGRLHDRAQALAGVRAARAAGFHNLGLDLIYGLPGQGMADWRADLETALALEPAHLSCYLLTYEDATPLGRARRAGRVRPLSDRAAAALFDFTHAFLEARGLSAYELSNFAARPEDRSRHNLKYWTLAPYLGLGPGAHSFEPPERWWNAADLAAYLDALGAGCLPEGGRETLTPGQQMLEAVFLGLRLTAGFDLEAFAARFGAAFESVFGSVAAGLEGEGLLAAAGGRCYLTPRGRRYHDAVSARFAAAV
jgi:oxygen-independent coproporphyrinogen-3 oxidase